MMRWSRPIRFSLRKAAKQSGLRRRRPLAGLTLEALESRVLLSTGEIHGVIFNDLNGDGQLQPAEPGIAGRIVYLDQNQNGVLDPGEQWTTTPADGSYSFTNLAPGLYHVAEQVPNSWKQTFPATESSP